MEGTVPAGDRDILGKTQLLNGVPHTIIGVAPEGFYGTFVGYRIQFWVPISMQESFEGAYDLEDRSARWIEGFVLPKPGVTAEQAEQELSTVARGLEAQYPQTNRSRGVEVLPLWKTPFNAASEQLPALKLSGGVVLLLLLIVCANVSNLLLVRSFARKREMVMRLAIGAGRDRLIGQLFTEGASIPFQLCSNWRGARCVLLPEPDCRGASIEGGKHQFERASRPASARAQCGHCLYSDAAVFSYTSDPERQGRYCGLVAVGIRRGVWSTRQISYPVRAGIGPDFT